MQDRLEVRLKIEPEKSEFSLSYYYVLFLAPGSHKFVRFFLQLVLAFGLLFFFCSISNTEILLQDLRTRFVQSQVDVAYTILTLPPTLSSQVLKEMEIDALTREFQVPSSHRSRASLQLPLDLHQA